MHIRQGLTIWAATVMVASLVGCADPESDDGGLDAGPSDNGIRADTGARDLGTNDTGTNDTGTNDTGADAQVLDGLPSGDAEPDASADADIDAGDPDSGVDAAFLEVLATNDAIHRGPGVADLLVTATGSISILHSPANQDVAISDLVNGAWVQRTPLVATAPLTGSALQFVDSSDGLVVAYLVNPGSGTSLATLVYDGAAWQPKTVPVTLSIIGTEAAFDLVLDLQSRALLVLAEGGGLQASRYESGAWANLGAPFHAGVGFLRGRMQANGNLLVAGQHAIPPFGSGVFAAEQTPGGAWSFIGPTPLDLIGDTTQQINVGDIVDGPAGALMTWNKGTCNAIGRYTAELQGATMTGRTDTNDVGNRPRVALLGGDLIVIYQPNCVSSSLAVRRLSGTTWGPELPFPVNATDAQLLVQNGQLYVVWWNAFGSVANVGRLNVP